MPWLGQSPDEAEIEELRAEVERLTGWRAKWMETAKALEAENERLTNELQECQARWEGYRHEKGADLSHE